MRTSAGLVAVWLLSVAGLLRAEPLNPQRVSADAKWLLHLDADAMRGSVVANAGYEQYKEKCKAIGQQIEELRTACQIFDPIKDLKAVTFYGTQFKDDAGVAIVHASFSESVLNTLYEAVQKLPDYKLLRHESHDMHAWTHAKGTPHQRSMIGVYVQPDLMLFGTSADEVAAALDVLDGAKPRLAEKTSPMSAPTPAGTLLELRLTGLSTVKLPIESPIIKRIEMLGLTSGESDQVSYLTIKLGTNDAKAAEEVKAVIDGILDSALLATENYEMSELLNAVRVTADDKMVTVDVRGPAQYGWFFLEKIAAKAVDVHKVHLGPQKQK
jgi:hypothetical protein